MTEEHVTLGRDEYDKHMLTVQEAEQYSNNETERIIAWDRITGAHHMRVRDFEARVDSECSQRDHIRGTSELAKKRKTTKYAKWGACIRAGLTVYAMCFFLAYLLAVYRTVYRLQLELTLVVITCMFCCVGMLIAFALANDRSGEARERILGGAVVAVWLIPASLVIYLITTTWRSMYLGFFVDATIPLLFVAAISAIPAAIYSGEYYEYYE